MTNTMHRQGDRESLNHDWVIFTHAAAGYNKKGSGPLHKKFAEICLKNQPSNMGIGEFLERKANFFEEYMRDRSRGTRFKDGKPTEVQLQLWAEMVEKMGEEHAYAVFSSPEQLGKVICELKHADLGISICINGLHEEADRLLREHGIVRHSIEHSLGFHGNVSRLPSREVLDIATMCGHGLVSFNLTKRMLDSVRLGEMTPERAAEHLMKGCTCGAFNPVRAATLISNAFRTSDEMASD